MTETRSAEEILLRHLGERALHYLLGLEDGQSLNFKDGTVLSLTSQQTDVLRELLMIDRGLVEGDPGPQSLHFGWQQILSRPARGVADSVGNAFRRVSGGVIYEPSSELTETDLALAELAIYYYPASLVSPPEVGFYSDFIPPIGSRAMHSRFESLILGDPAVMTLFSENEPSTGQHGSSNRSTGQSNGHQLSLLASMLTRAGRNLAGAVTDKPAPHDVVAATLDSLAIIRSSLHGEAPRVPARIGLVGVVLPAEVDELDLGWGRLRKTDARDEPVVRSTSIKGEFSTSDADGNIVLAKYSGDVVLELKLPYKININRPQKAFTWPKERDENRLLIEQSIENVRLGLLLSSPESKPVIAESWTTIFDPLATGPSLSWRDTANVHGLTAIQANERQARDWALWTTRVHEHRTQSIKIALRRLLTAVSDRSVPEDVLVDSVIVWENLFGAKTETTFRVTASLAWLLGESAADRVALQSQYKAIYTARSRVVHGDPTIKPDAIQSRSSEAVEVSIEALRAVFTSHVHLLQISTSEDRGLQLMLKN
ncbi:hypothetical protein [Humidisolicoccus flavus]|uniref:hypothetical protein n=1 Tax=Humidisolicoccus flavus TaxID=3111414 RepID=UPI003243A7AE